MDFDLKKYNPFKIDSSDQFNEVAIKIFQYQAENNVVYAEYLKMINIEVAKINKVDDIPFLPIEFFKTHKVSIGNGPSDMVFKSSGTTKQNKSIHYVKKRSVYEESFLATFNEFYGAPLNYCILGLLPSYHEQGDSSLVYMVNHLMEMSKHSKSGFYLNDTAKVPYILKELDQQGQKVMLFGVSYALLDLVEKDQFHLKHTIVIETGGMKGRRKELIKKELHERLCKGFGVEKIHSEYGMTELLSQAYSSGNGVFKCPPWMKVMIRDPTDALTLSQKKKAGGINIIDLANIYSCSFIATQDLGKLADDGSFEIIGRFDQADIRGCNLMVI